MMKISNIGNIRLLRHVANMRNVSTKIMKNIAIQENLEKVGKLKKNV